MKQEVKQMKGNSLSTRLERLRFSYRIIPQTTTGISPTQLLMGQRLKAQMDLVKPSLEDLVKQQQQKQSHDSDRHPKAQCFITGHLVYTLYYK